MPLTTTDWVVIVGYLLINLLIGIYYRRRASGNTAEFFISGRDVSWWLAGTSMVATTFAADGGGCGAGGLPCAGQSRRLEVFAGSASPRSANELSRATVQFIVHDGHSYRTERRARSNACVR